LITTLGALFIYRGLVYFFTGGFPIRLPTSVKDDTLIYVLGGNLLSNFNNAIIYLVFIMLMFVLILSRTRYGNHVVAVGGDPQTALSQGISPVKIKMIAFIICSLLTGLSGIISACYFSSVAATVGEGMELETIAAAVIGGCSLRGGIGSIWGAVLGVVMLLTIKNGLIIMGIDILWYLIILGLLLIGSILFKELLSAL
jgi:ribose/xylose/arabinose/galactoside ABC-type transport system permease subunit